MAKEKILRGIAAAKGIAHGHAFIYETKQLNVFQTPILSVYLKDEVERFEQARNRLGDTRKMCCWDL